MGNEGETTSQIHNVCSLVGNLRLATGGIETSAPTSVRENEWSVGVCLGSPSSFASTEDLERVVTKQG